MITSLMLCSYAGFDVLKYFFSWLQVFWQRIIKWFVDVMLILVCFLVHGQGTIIFVVSVGLSVYVFVCLCRVFLSRLWSDFD